MISLRIPYLNVQRDTFSEQLYERFCIRYGTNRATQLVSALSRPVNNFALRVNLLKISNEKLLERFVFDGWNGTIHPLFDEILIFKTIGPLKVPYMPEAAKIQVDKVAAESVLVGADLYSAGIIRQPKFNKNEILSLISQKDQIVGVGKAQINSKTNKKFGVAFENLVSFYKVPSIERMGLVEEGFAYSQSIPAACVAHLLNPQPNEKILDLCAAPGGKSTGAAILVRDKAKIVAFDRSKKRLEKMDKVIKNHGIKNIELIQADSVSYLKTHVIKADKVLVDPSCSATGIRPKIYDNTSTQDIINSSKYQKSFIWAANKIIRKGGIIIYSTCSLEPEENEKVISYAVNDLGLSLINSELKLGAKGEDTTDGLDIDYMRRFYPDIHDTPGFFIAQLTKK